MSALAIFSTNDGLEKGQGRRTQANPCATGSTVSRSKILHLRFPVWAETIDQIKHKRDRAEGTIFGGESAGSKHV